MRVKRFASMLVATVLIVMHALPASAATFEINLFADARGDTSTSQGFFLFPNIQVLEDELYTSSYVEFSSPASSFRGYVNHPEGSSASSLSRATTSDLVSRANGIWKLAIEQGGLRHEYAVDVSFNPPFEELLHITSNSLVHGAPVGSFEWSLHGGSEEYPGSTSQFSLALRPNLPGFQPPLASASLPADATQWVLPSGIDYSVAEEFRAAISVWSTDYDYSVFQINGIQALTPDAPDVVFTSSAVRYGATFSTVLTAPVPEPSTVVLSAMAGLALLGVAIRRRHTRK